MGSGRTAGPTPGAKPVLARLGRAAGCALAVGALLVAAPAAGLAADEPSDDQDGAVTWAVTPADADGPDGRHWIELEADPGQTVTEHLAVKNLSDIAVEFGLVAADGYFTAGGRYAMLNHPEDSVDAGTWIELPESVSVPANQTALVPFTITVPENAEPGDHAGGVAASIISKGSGEDGANLGVVSRVGFRVMTRVSGELRPSLAVENLDAAYDTVWHPFRPGRMAVEFDLVNTGNSRLTVTGAVRSGDGQTAFPAESEAIIELLPGSRRHIGLVVTDVWPLFRSSVTVVARPVVPEVLEGSAPTLEPIQVRMGAWAWPWPQLAVLAGLALIATGLMAGRRRSRRRLNRLIERALAAERAKAADPQPNGSPADGDQAEAGEGAGARDRPEETRPRHALVGPDEAADKSTEGGRK
ncbi:MAG: DUF916 domain-containing protein [Bifidobacteriaceae bacterium]|jgi:hypothetical protein|nr:DUF916 domain-containing protein [Bifidobacteriaceae bacterium]